MFSTTYSDAREKFVAMGNRLRDQLIQAQGDQTLVVLDVKSISYDVSDVNTIVKYGDYANYIDTLQTSNATTSQTISPGKDTVDALLLTLYLPNINGVDEDLDIIHSSGTHGVEGYLGSAVQLSWLHELILQNQKQLTSSTDAARDFSVRRVLLIHAVNPFGMRHHRRTDQSNVDINRNSLATDMFKSLQSRDPNFASYVDMDSALNPFPSVTADGERFSWVDTARRFGYEGDASKLAKQDEMIQKRSIRLEKHSDTSRVKIPCDNLHSWIEERMEMLHVLRSMAKYIITLGYTNAKRALVSGQYLKPSGTQYGGGAHQYHERTPENSVVALQHAINDFAAFHLNSSRSSTISRRVFWIDVHTGLGKYATDSMLHAGKKSDRYDWVLKLTEALGLESHDDFSSGYDLTKGFVNDALNCPLPRCFSVTQEFGTRPGVLVALSFILDNKGYQQGTHQYGYMNSFAFYPNRISWRQKSLRGGMKILNAAAKVSHRDEYLL